MVYHRILNIVLPCAISRTLLLIHPICNSLHLLTPNSQSTPPPTPSPWQPQVCSLCHLTVLFIYFIYVFLATLGPRCCVQVFSSCGEQGLLFVAVNGLLIAVASLAAEHGL